MISDLYQRDGQENDREFVIGLPYWHPLCPLHPGHARIYVIADLIAKHIRYATNGATRVYTPYGSHYSGSTAAKWVHTLRAGGDQAADLRALFARYGVGDDVVDEFTTPQRILDHFTDQIIDNLRDMHCEVPEPVLRTVDPDYSAFVGETFQEMEKRGTLVIQGPRAALDYAAFLDEAVAQSRVTRVFSRGNAEILRVGIRANIENRRNREDYFVDIFQPHGPGGHETFSVKYQGVPLDPMHDSLLYDVHNSRTHGFELPVDLFLAEDHLSTWLGRKTFAECMFLAPEHRTRSYFILGSATFNGRHMSSSQGNAIFPSELAKTYGARAVRVYMLLLGHPLNVFDVAADTYQQAVGAAARGVRRLDSAAMRLRGLPSVASDDPPAADLVGHFSRRLADSFNTCALDRYAQIAVFELPRALNRLHASNHDLKEFVRQVRHCVTGVPAEEETR
jgi:leucyl-tRNA synthetase